MNRTATLAVLATVMMTVSCASGSKSSPATRPIRTPPPGARLSGDYQKFQGEWLVTHNELRRQNLREMTGAIFMFQGDRFRISGDPPGSERFIIDEKSDPKRIDFDDGKPPKILGIYKFDGNDLTICTGGPGEPRPTEFVTSYDTGNVLTKLKKQE